jgi:hypothetical protein
VVSLSNHTPELSFNLTKFYEKISL